MQPKVQQLCFRIIGFAICSLQFAFRTKFDNEALLASLHLIGAQALDPFIAHDKTFEEVSDREVALQLKLRQYSI